MFGGSGNDTYVIDNVGDVADETGGSGTDTIQSSIGFSLLDAVHAKGTIENLTLTGSAAINGVGNGLANVIAGNAAANVLEGLGGADSLIGGAGIDTASYAASSSGVSVSLVTGEGSGGDAEGDTLTEIENLTGSGHDDFLQGTAGNNVLIGGAGIDTVSYANSSSRGVQVSLAVTSRQSTGGSGIDTLSGFENLIGTRVDDGLTGDAGDNILNGGQGADRLIGGAGDDILIAGGVFTRPFFDDLQQRPRGNDILTGDAGSDTFVFAFPRFALADNGRCIVTDFTSGVDKLDMTEILSDFGLSGLDYDELVAQGYLTIATGSFSTGQRTNSAAIQDTRIYISSSGAPPGTLVATLEDTLTTSDDFLL